MTRIIRGGFAAGHEVDHYSLCRNAGRANIFINNLPR